VLSAKHVIGGVTYIAAIIAGPGVIRHSGRLQKLVFGEYDGSRSPRVRQFAAACVDSDIDAEASPAAPICSATWSRPATRCLP
jgi:2-dehydropantoate 2-reductase